MADQHPAGAQAGHGKDNLIPGVKYVIAVSSGKGGVGKSTVAVNLAVALGLTGAKVGLCDCDLYGPSVALMMGTSEHPMQNDAQQIVPVENHGLQLISMGLLLSDDAPVIVRGPIATRYTQQFLRQCLWGELDYLVLDLPPGTGDIQLTIVQTVSISGSVIVTTPQDIALLDARKGLKMFEKVGVPIVGIVENMSYFVCPDSGKKYDIFGHGGGAEVAKQYDLPLLAEIPIDPAIREGGDAGKPAVEIEGSAAREAFLTLASKVAELAVDVPD